MDRVINFQNFAFIMAWFVCCISTLGQLSPATTIIQVAHHALDREEEFRTMLERTDLLRSSDLPAALENASHSLDLAKSLGNPNYEAVAQMDLASIQCLLAKHDDPAGSTEVNVMDLIELPDDASSLMRGHFELAKFESRIWLELLSDPNDDTVGIQVATLEELATESGNANLLLRARAFSMFAMAFLSKSSSDIPTIAIEQLKEDSEASKFNDGVIIALLLEAKAHRSRSNERLACYENARLLAEKSESGLLQFHATMRQAAHHMAKKDSDGARSALEAAENLADQLGVQSLERQVYWKLFRLEKKSKNIRKAGERFIGFLSLENRQLHPLERDYIYSQGQELVEEAGDPELAKELGSFRLSKEDRKAFYQSRMKIRELNNIVEEAEKERQEQIAALNKLDQKLNNEVFSLKKSFVIASLVALGLACVTLFLIFQSRIWAKSKFQKQAVEENRKIYDELSVRVTRMERMESLGMMAGGVAHDFNNILVGVMSNAEVIQMANQDENDFIRARLSGIIKSAQEAASLSEKMLVCSGRGVSNPKWCQLNQIIRDHKLQLENSCVKDQNLVVKLGSDDIFTNLDSLQVLKAVDNLVLNAAEASGEASQIVLRTGEIEIESAEDNSLFGTRNSGGKFCFVEVADEGCGIPESDIERIFEPFWSKKFVGRGLGLAFVYGIVEQHHGFVQCRSSVGDSTVVRLLFPMIDQGAVADDFNINRIKDQFEEFTSNNEGHRFSDRKKLLLIDDDPNVRELSSQLLSHAGYSPILASSGQEGLDMIEEYSDELMCVLLDIMMPTMSGDKVLELMVERGLNFPVIVLTGFHGERPKSVEAHPNVVDLIRKPFQSSRLLQAVSQIAELINSPE